MTHQSTLPEWNQVVAALQACSDDELLARTMLGLIFDRPRLGEILWPKLSAEYDAEDTASSACLDELKKANALLLDEKDRAYEIVELLTEELQRTEEANSALQWERSESARRVAQVSWQVQELSQSFLVSSIFSGWRNLWAEVTCRAAARPAAESGSAGSSALTEVARPPLVKMLVKVVDTCHGKPVILMALAFFIWRVWMVVLQHEISARHRLALERLWEVLEAHPQLHGFFCRSDSDRQAAYVIFLCWRTMQAEACRARQLTPTQAPIGLAGRSVQALQDKLQAEFEEGIRQANFDSCVACLSLSSRANALGSMQILFASWIMQVRAMNSAKDIRKANFNSCVACLSLSFRGSHVFSVSSRGSRVFLVSITFSCWKSLWSGLMLRRFVTAKLLKQQLCSLLFSVLVFWQRTLTHATQNLIAHPNGFKQTNKNATQRMIANHADLDGVQGFQHQDKDQAMYLGVLSVLATAQAKQTMTMRVSFFSWKSAWMSLMQEKAVEHQKLELRTMEVERMCMKRLPSAAELSLRSFFFAWQRCGLQSLRHLLVKEAKCQQDLMIQKSVALLADSRSCFVVQTNFLRWRNLTQRSRMTAKFEALRNDLEQDVSRKAKLCSCLLTRESDMEMHICFVSWRKQILNGFLGVEREKRETSEKEFQRTLREKGFQKGAILGWANTSIVLKDMFDNWHTEIAKHHLQKEMDVLAGQLQTSQMLSDREAALASERELALKTILSGLKEKCETSEADLTEVDVSRQRLQDEVDLLQGRLRMSRSEAALMMERKQTSALTRTIFAEWENVFHKQAKIDRLQAHMQAKIDRLQETTLLKHRKTATIRWDSLNTGLVTAVFGAWSKALFLSFFASMGKNARGKADDDYILSQSNGKNANENMRSICQASNNEELASEVQHLRQALGTYHTENDHLQQRLTARQFQGRNIRRGAVSLLKTQRRLQKRTVFTLWILAWTEASMGALFSIAKSSVVSSFREDATLKALESSGYSALQNNIKSPTVNRG